MVDVEDFAKSSLVVVPPIWIAVTASPREAPGARLNDTVVAGNWPRWLIAKGAVCSMICATEGEMEIICDRLDGCSTRYLWAHVRDAVTAALDAMTLADVVRANEAELAGRAPDGTRLISLSPRLPRNPALDTAGR